MPAAGDELLHHRPPGAQKFDRQLEQRRASLALKGQDAVLHIPVDSAVSVSATTASTGRAQHLLRRATHGRAAT